MSLRQFLVDGHSDEVGHHVHKAKSCIKMAGHHDALGKCMSMPVDAQEHHRHLAECYKSEAAFHTAEAEKHIEKARSASMLDFEGDTHGPAKVAIGDPATRFSKDVDGVAGVHPSMPERLRLVPRSGDLEDLAKTQAEENLAAHPAFARRTA